MASRISLAKPARSLRQPRGANQAFNVKSFLELKGPRRTVQRIRAKEIIFSQGQASDAVFYIQEGQVKITVLNTRGKEAVVAILGKGDFCGEACLGGDSVYIVSATAISQTDLLVIEKEEMARVLHEESELSDRFIAYMLTRNARVQQDLIDQLFNSTEKRLARTLLLLANYGKPGGPQEILPKVSQETLAEIIGSTRSRVNLFMNKFRRLGFIEYKARLNKYLRVCRIGQSPVARRNMLRTRPVQWVRRESEREVREVSLYIPSSFALRNRAYVRAANASPNATGRISFRG